MTGDAAVRTVDPNSLNGSKTYEVPLAPPRMGPQPRLPYSRPLRKGSPLPNLAGPGHTSQFP